MRKIISGLLRLLFVSINFNKTHRNANFAAMISKPTSSFGWLDNYIGKVSDESLIEGFKRQTHETLELISSLSEEKLNFRYAENKWNIKELMIHLLDAERVFAFRALCFSRKDKTPLPGFEEDDYVKNCGANERSIKSILEEYIVTRTATVALFSNFNKEMLDFVGIANGKEMSARALGYATLGHEIHHISVIKEKYLI